MENFTPVAGLIGGLLIGLSAALLVVANGRVAGISGILGGLLRPAGGEEVAWRGAFLVGLLAAPALYALFGGSVPTPQVDAPVGLLIVAGILVGIGTQMGAGCTSGHGVCGTARLSRRSLAAMGTFMAVAFVTVFVMRHVLGG